MPDQQRPENRPSRDQSTPMNVTRVQNAILLATENAPLHVIAICKPMLYKVVGKEQRKPRVIKRDA